MSIERNSIDPYFDGLWRTIKTMSTIKHNSSTTYTIYSYIHLVNSGILMTKSCRYDGTMVVRATIPTGASGYLCGRHCTGNSTNNMYIKVANGTVTWNMKGTDIATHTLEEGMHDYGFVGGYAVYDNQRLDSQSTAPSGIAYAPAMVFGGAVVYETASSPSYSYMSEVYIHRVDFDSYLTLNPSSSETPDLCRFYPTGSARMYDALKLVYQSVSVSNGSGGSSDITGATNVTYGVQLDDLKYIFGSRYRDLMAVVCEDGGEDSRSGQDPNDVDSPYQITYDGTTHNFAFALPNTKYPGGTTPTESGVDKRGRLMCGRTPKWDIWQDSVAHGFYIKEEEVSPNVWKFTLEFNIFKLGNGTDTPIRLEWFDGYNEDPENSHPPKLTFTKVGETSETTTMNIEYHNGENYICSDDNSIYLHEDSNGVKDHLSLFIASRAADLAYNVKLGNAIPWNLTTQEITNTSRKQDYAIIGGGVTISAYGVVYGRSNSRESTYMCADSPASAADRTALMNKYRYNGFGNQIVFNYLAPSLLEQFRSHSTIPAEAQVVLFSNVSQYSGTDIIEMPELIGKKTLTMTRTIDPAIGYHSSITNRRNLLTQTIGNINAAFFIPIECNLVWTKNDGSVSANDPTLILLAVHECKADGSDLNLSPTNDFTALIYADFADNDGYVTQRAIALVPSVTGITGTGTNPYTDGTKEHAMFRFAAQYIYSGSWYRRYNGSRQMIGNSRHWESTTRLLAATADQMGGLLDLDKANIRVDLFSSANPRILCRFGRLGDPTDESQWLDKATSVALGTGANDPYYVCRYPDVDRAAGELTICAMDMCKYTHTGTDFRTGWSRVYEGPEYTTARPTFNKKVRLDKFGTGFSQLCTFDFSSGNDWTESGSGSSKAFTKTRSDEQSLGYTCTIMFHQSTMSLNDPTGYPLTPETWGAIWYYEVSIQAPSNTQSCDTFRVSLVNP